MLPLTRQKKGCLAAILIGAAAHRFGIVKPQRKERKPSEHRDRLRAMNDIAALDDRRFKKRYRMGKARHAQLLFEIRSDLERDEQKAVNSAGSPVFPYLQLCIGLRMVSGGSYLDIADAHKVHESTVNPITWRVIDAINLRIKIVHFPFSNVRKLEEHAKTFFARCEELPGTVAAGDGVAFGIECPEDHEVGGDRKSQFSRKGFYTYSVLAFCDALLRIMAVHCDSCGSTNDGLQYVGSWLHKTIEEGKLPPKFHVVLDEAFRCSQQELTNHSRPKSPQVLSDAKDAFNFYLSLHRCNIERCFGLFTWRWGIFWRPIRTSFGSIKDIVACCSRLHNWCQEEVECWKIFEASRPNAAFDAAVLESIQEHDDEDLVWRRTNERVQSSRIVQPPGAPLLFIPGSAGASRQGQRNDLDKTSKRAAFTAVMERRGLKRPTHSADAQRKRRMAGKN